MVLRADGPHPMKQLVQEWVNKVDRARERRKPWLEIAEDCETFYAQTWDIWGDKYRDKYWKPTRENERLFSPNFAVSIALGFELVAIIGPALYWRNPRRTANPKPPFMIPEDLLQAAPPELQQVYQQVMMEYQQALPTSRLRAYMMERYLNWSAQECRLHNGSELAVTEAIVMGRGCLWTEPYQPPGTDTIVVSSWFDTVKNLLIDPDCTSAQFEDAYWIAKQVTEPVWKIARDRRIPEEILRKYTTGDSQGNIAELAADPAKTSEILRGRTQDQLTYWKLWTRLGIGGRLDGIKRDEPGVIGMLDDYCPDYCYLEVARGIPFFLNFTTEDFEAMLDAPDDDSADQVLEKLHWPVPTWRDRRWPCNALDFYRKSTSPYPLPILAQGIGELKALNILFAQLLEHTWISLNDFIVVAQGAAEELKKTLQNKEGAFTLIELEGMYKSINEVVGFLQHPPANLDAWQMCEKLIQMLHMRLGTAPLSYGMQGEQASRSATDVKVRQGNLGVRPEFMASKVEEWQGETARTEAIATRWLIRGQHVQRLMGQTGAMLWEQLIVASPVELTTEEIDYGIEAQSGRRRNKDRDAENLNTFMQQFAPLFQAAMQAGDMGPLNEAARLFGEHAEFDTSRLRFGASPQFQQQQAQQQQMQQAQMQAQQQAAQQKMGMDQQKMQMDAAGKQQELQFKGVAHQQDMQHKQEAHTMEMQKSAAEMAMAQAQAEQDALREIVRMKIQQIRPQGRGKA